MFRGIDRAPPNLSHGRALIVPDRRRPPPAVTCRPGRAAPLGEADLLVVAPYNAQVDIIIETLAAAGAGGVRVGTVDKFQGQEAPVVIFSTASSSPDDALRGMEFLYDPHRLNVATSRGRCAAILIASPRLFEPACRTPRQIQLASAFCRFRELATVVRL